MDINAIGIGAGVIGVIGLAAGLWGHVKALLGYLQSIVVVTVEASGHYGVTEDVMSAYLLSHATCRGTVKHMYWIRRIYVRPTRKLCHVANRVIPEGSLVFWFGWRPVLVTRQLYKKDSSSSLKIYFLRGMFKPDEFATKAAAYCNELEEGRKAGSRFRIHVLNGIGFASSRQVDQSGAPPPGEPADDIIALHSVQPLGYTHDDLGYVSFSRGVKHTALSKDAERAVGEARQWCESKEWFLERGITWRYSWLLHGPAGTGKTSLARGVAEELDLPVYAFNLATMCDLEFINGWRQAATNTPAMVLFEDIDTVFEGRTNIHTNDMFQGVTFGTFLNTLDGIQKADGIFVVMTTNHLDKIDAALSETRGDGMRGSRPGRIDRVVFMGPLDEQGREKIAQRILSSFPGWKRGAVVDAGEGETGAQFENRCVEAAMKAFRDGELIPKEEDVLEKAEAS